MIFFFSMELSLKNPMSLIIFITIIIVVDLIIFITIIIVVDLIIFIIFKK
jgi:hypothetical protein